MYLSFPGTPRIILLGIHIFISYLCPKKLTVDTRARAHTHTHTHTRTYTLPCRPSESPSLSTLLYSRQFKISPNGTMNVQSVLIHIMYHDRLARHSVGHHKFEHVTARTRVLKTHLKFAYTTVLHFRSCIEVLCVGHQHKDNSFLFVYVYFFNSNLP